MKSIFQLKITLDNFKPEINRTVLVESDIDLHRLHLVIQYAMGWDNSHLYYFENNETRYDVNEEVYDKASNYDFGVYKVKLKQEKNNWDELFAKMPHMAKYVRVPKKDVDCREKTISEIFNNQGDNLSYTYDLTDNWKHTLTVEKILSPEEGKFYPVCTEANRACPLEDCGGVPGYTLYLEAIKDKDHPNHQDMLEWLDGEFDPEGVDLKKINMRLTKMFTSKAALLLKA
ncbi:MAG: plasmid pRiA4b ORF-3 family protein [Bacteroidota bacterium]|nr:plasmid pRiA4b ORF-3 family protein [Bacteroidota bacterium]